MVPSPAFPDSLFGPEVSVLRRSRLPVSAVKPGMLIAIDRLLFSDESQARPLHTGFCAF